MLSSIFLVFMLYDQLRNIALNITTNEKVNCKRYVWLRTPVNGKFFNWYDRGFWCNCTEFWKLEAHGNRVREREREIKYNIYIDVFTWLCCINQTIQSKLESPPSGLLFSEFFSSRAVNSATTANEQDRAACLP